MLTWLKAFSLANLCLISGWFSPLYDVDHGYFNRLRVTLPTLLAIAANFLWFAGLAWVIARWVRRARSRALELIAHMLLFSSWLLPLDFLRRQALEIPDYQVLAFVKMPGVTVAIILFLALLVWKHPLFARINEALLLILSPLALFTFLRIALLGLGIMHLEQWSLKPLLASPAPVRPGQPRVVWMIFDGMDYRLAFEQRPAGLKLPEFDRLRAGSLFATNAYTPADCTLISMPALITGKRLEEATLRSSSDLNLVLSDGGGVLSWSQTPSVFSAARELGANTALVGWYHPYDRVLGKDLNFCEWHPIQVYESARAPRFDQAMLNQIACLTGTLRARTLYIGICQQSLAEALQVVTNNIYGMSLLHLPPPHKPGVYNRERQEYTRIPSSKPQGYMNNLALADHFLGELRGAMEGSGLWDQTWIIISADHSWGESRVYDGRRDLRVPYIVKPPGEGRTWTYGSAFNTVLTHDLILNVLRGNLKGEADTAAWLDAQAAKQVNIKPTQERSQNEP